MGDVEGCCDYSIIGKVYPKPIECSMGFFIFGGIMKTYPVNLVLQGQPVVLVGGNLEIARVENDPRERLTAMVDAGASINMKELMEAVTA